MSLSVWIEKDLNDFRLRVNFETNGAFGVLGASGCGKSYTLKCSGDRNAGQRLHRSQRKNTL